MPDSQAQVNSLSGMSRTGDPEGLLPVLFGAPTEAVCEEGEDGIGTAQSPERPYV